MLVQCAKLLIQAGIVEVIYAEACASSSVFLQSEYDLLTAGRMQGKLGSSAAQEPPAVPRHDGRATSLRCVRKQVRLGT